MKKFKIIFTGIVMFYVSHSANSKNNLGIYTGFGVTDFEIPELNSYQPTSFGYYEFTNSSHKLNQVKLSLVWDNILSNRFGLTYAMEYEHGIKASFKREALNNIALRFAI